ncbi:MAG: exodeoxyribonuclease VII small subunit [Solirubrobacterales bacterium]
MSPPATPTDITFADAYDELKAITTKLNNEEVEADELVELLRRGKGLEAVLREHLTNIEQEVTAIENGDGVTPFRIIKNTDTDSGLGGDGSTGAGDLDPSRPASGDDIPF